MLKWVPATIVRRLGNVMYEIKVNGNCRKAHIRQLRKMYNKDNYRNLKVHENIIVTNTLENKCKKNKEIIQANSDKQMKSYQTRARTKRNAEISKRRNLVEIFNTESV